MTPRTTATRRAADAIRAHDSSRMAMGSLSVLVILGPLLLHTLPGEAGSSSGVGGSGSDPGGSSSGLGGGRADDSDGYGSPSEFGEDDVASLDGAPYWEWEGASESTGLDDRRRVGRPREHEVGRDEFTVACSAGYFESDFEAEFGLSAQQTKRLKKQWGLLGVAEAARRNMPSLEHLQQWWADDPTLTTAVVAHHAGVSAKALRTHFRRVGFSPPSLRVDDDALLDAIRTLYAVGWCRQAGATFMAARLYVRFGIVASPAQIRRALKVLDPEAHSRRAREAAATQYQYNVKGARTLLAAPRSLALLGGDPCQAAAAPRRVPPTPPPRRPG